MTNGVSKIASSIAPNCSCWIQLIKSFSQSATNPILRLPGIFHTNKVMAQVSAIALLRLPLKSCQTNLAAVKLLSCICQLSH